MNKDTWILECRQFSRAVDIKVVVGNQTEQGMSDFEHVLMSFLAHGIDCVPDRGRRIRETQMMQGFHDLFRDIFRVVKEAQCSSKCITFLVGANHKHGDYSEMVLDVELGPGAMKDRG
jgi:hypothetical protein